LCLQSLSMQRLLSFSLFLNSNFHLPFTTPSHLPIPPTNYVLSLFSLSSLPSSSRSALSFRDSPAPHRRSTPVANGKIPGSPAPHRCSTCLCPPKARRRNSYTPVDSYTPVWWGAGLFREGPVTRYGAKDSNREEGKIGVHKTRKKKHTRLARGGR
jgi:hypothetical protein